MLHKHIPAFLKNNYPLFVFRVILVQMVLQAEMVPQDQR